MSEPREAVILHALEEVAARASAAGRLEPPAGEAVLRSVVEAAVAVFEAQAASIALPDREAGRLVIRVAAGPAADGAEGLAFNASEGIAGYVFTTGQPLAVADAGADPRFDRRAAESTGYVPRTILAVPLLGEEGTVGVLEILDRRGDGATGLRDLDVASLFARQAVVAIRASRIERDTAELLRLTLARLAADPGADRAALDEAVAAVALALDDEDDGRLWALADAVARARRAAPDQVALVVEILDSLARRGARPASRSFRR
jgi:GAF domain-containing protein